MLKVYCDRCRTETTPALVVRATLTATRADGAWPIAQRTADLCDTCWHVVLTRFEHTSRGIVPPDLSQPD